MTKALEIDKVDPTDEEVVKQIFALESETEQIKLKGALRDKAKSMGKTKQFDEIYKALKKIAMADDRHTSQRITRFDLEEGYLNIPCGSWIADDSGVRIQTDKGTIWACKHPILPVERLTNIQTGFEQMKIAYKRGGVWKYKTFPKDVLATQSKIVGLSNYGILVNSDNAKDLLKYFTDVEAGAEEYAKQKHEDLIKTYRSSSKFGWIEGLFLPYDKNIEFDSENRFAQLLESIRTHGSRDEWMKLIKGIRAKGSQSFPVCMMMAASFASVLLDKLGALPYFIDLWGDTEGGKTVTLMTAASIWADPDENKYIGDFKTTDTALEIKANALNNLPLILDDTAKISQKMRDSFEGFVYDITSGKGKSRSDRDLGIRHENSWKLAVLTTGESPLMGFVTQGGAINRILELQSGSMLFDDPVHVANTVKANYGFAGIEFIEVVKKLGDEELRRIFKGKLELIEAVAPDKMKKQSISLATILTADQIATDYIFKDDSYIDVRMATSVLIDPVELSINERAYEYVIDKINMNMSRFNNTANTEQWGIIKDGNVYFYVEAFRQLLEAKQYSVKSFYDWAKKKRKIIPDKDGGPTKVKRFGNSPSKRVIELVFPTEDEADPDFQAT